jgi:hypothetical protein
VLQRQQHGINLICDLIEDRLAGNKFAVRWQARHRFWIRRLCAFKVHPKRRRRFALPAHSK